ncbi:hypothetical protein G7K_1305-t1 [Saitoella complicata NRRL Y-17804]|uniref:Eukaryotic translation initiation factor 3 subunit B n=1 Tax=Saitoella complicata (strain BCRC 22490 / CBS 7301 / JCM 7358 / NBRC 10748 / NRRL Y-17804) TaxID=698492 RepID=A0A0E9NBB3_SAICN|nr:hypothetical protein G7K_1305-t1 [Saitoella complicata NRRL Y-17804]
MASEMSNGTQDRYDDEEIDFSDLEEKFQVPFEEGFDTLVLVDGAPVVPDEKREVLLKVMKKLFSSAGKVKDDGIFMPMEENSKGKLMSKGFMFVEYETPEQADAAVKALNGRRMDKQHTLSANRFTDVEKYANVSEEYVEPEEEPFVEQEHLRSWLADAQARDQWVMYRGDEVSVNWNRKGEQPDVDVQRMNWTETYVQWSPQGTYLTSFHRQGIQLWGGPSWKRMMRFAHPGVNLIDFSPNEQYLVTWSNEPITLLPIGHPGRAAMPFGPEDEGKQVIVWDLKTGALLRSFAAPAQESDAGPKKITWPMFKWSSSEKYFARLSPGQISIYEAPGMGLLDKKSVKVDGIVDFDWAPAMSEANQKNDEEYLGYWTPEVGNQPARVALMSVPSKQTIRTKNLFNVSDCKIHWQSNGDYMCVKVDRHTKTKKSTFSNLEIFRVKEKNIPVEEVEVKDTILNFAWEPKGSRFAIISTSDPNLVNLGQPGTPPLRTTLSFYAFEKTKAKEQFRCVKTADKKTLNAIFWSPKGRFLIAATMGQSSTFDLEFWDMDFEGENTNKEEGSTSNPTVIGNIEHYGVTDIEWDPTGRYVTTSASAWRHTIENGYKLWDFKGTLLREEPLDRFKQLLWRPRPATLLSKEQQKKIRKNLREYSRIFDEEDLQEQTLANKELVAQRRRLVEEWTAWREKVVEQLHRERTERGLPEDDIVEGKEDGTGDQVVEVEIEEVVEETVEVLDS